jgi:AraC-like DNA-binding protein
MDFFIYSKAEHHLKNIEVIDDFSCIREFGHERYVNIQSSTLRMHYNKGIEICFVKKGRYNWTVDGKDYAVLPGEGFVTCPWQFHGSTQGVIDLGEIVWLVLTPQQFLNDGLFKMQPWTTFTPEEEAEIGNTLALNNNPIIPNGHGLEDLFVKLNQELTQRPFGFQAKIRHLLEDILLSVVRLIKCRDYQAANTEIWVSRFKELLEEDLSRNWQLLEMAEAFDMGTTSLSEKVKRLTGYPPKSYLIHLRIEQAKRLLRQPTKSLTAIALECGFYSSQHFANTFRKWTGCTPSQYRGNQG